MDMGRLLSEKRGEIRTVASKEGAAKKTPTAKQRAALREIEQLDKRLSGHFDGKILVQPNGKGNSSQQMGEHEREALRKCVYVWRKE
jgi:regulator of protease activity HflC (stomatin/prohibitin superfamily)